MLLFYISDHPNKTTFKANITISLPQFKKFFQAYGVTVDTQRDSHFAD